MIAWWWLDNKLFLFLVDVLVDVLRRRRQGSAICTSPLEIHIDFTATKWENWSSCRFLMIADCKKSGFNLICKFQTVAVRTLYITLWGRDWLSLSNCTSVSGYFIGLGTHLWTLDGVKKTLRKKIRAPIQQAFAETLTQTAYATFKAWFDTTGAANRKWMRITEDT